MSILWILVIAIVILLLILLGTFMLGLWDQVEFPPANTQEMINAYSIPSAWSSGLPVPNASCQAYTFISTDGTIPQPGIDHLNNTSDDIVIFPIQQECTDSDQIFAQNSFHVCRYGDFPDIPITQFDGCPLKTGGFTKINGFYEEYYNTCGVTTQSSLTESNSTRCIGSIGLITYNFTGALGSSTCILDPLYTIDGSNVIIPANAPLRVAHPTLNSTSFSGGCSITATQNNFPSQLFRVTRYSYDPKTTSLTQNNSGSFLRITHRPTGKCIAPYTLGTDGKTVSVSFFNPNLSPILVDASSFGNHGAWWYVTTTMNTPSYLITDPTQSQRALPQLIWAPVPSVIGTIEKDPIQLWTYLTSGNVFSLVPFTIDSSGSPVYNRMSMVKFTRLLYKPAAAINLPNILPPTNTNSTYYPTLLECQNNYAPFFANISTSGCYKYNSTYKGFPKQIGTETIIVPLAQTDACYLEYSNFKYYNYQIAIASAKQRVLAEAGAVNYIDLTLLNIILNQSSNFYNL